MLLFKNHSRIILGSKSQNIKNHKAQIKFIEFLYKECVKEQLSMAASGRIEQTERTIFQLLLQQITVVLEVPKIGFKICLTFFLTFFLTKILIYEICHVYVKLQVWLYKSITNPFL